nr:fasciclin domain-containing protein [uncultured Flavobacterium sp.]
MKRLLRLPSLLKFTLVFLIALVFQNCTEQKIKESTDETLNITDYLRDTPDYSMFLEILEITNYAPFMNTYGTYTLFLPTNDAVKEYLKSVGANSLKDVPLADLQNIVKLHILDQKINTTSFTDGKLTTPSLYGQFLVTGATNKNGGESSTTVNKTASILKSNVEVGNGVIHVIDKVLRVADKTLAQTIEQDQSLSLFTEALKITGWYDVLNKPIDYTKNDIDSYLTVLAQTNDAFKAAGINNIEELKAKYSHLHKPLDPKDSLNLFVSYRILPKLQYLADLAVSPALVTKAPLEVISAKLEKDVILLNEEVFNNVLEKGVAIVREKSDVTASNGVLHFVDANFAIKKRLPAPVYFDFCDQNEFRQLTSIFRLPPTGRASLAKELFKDITWDGPDAITYFKDPAKGGTVGFGWHGDCLEIFKFRDGICQNIAFKTPVIIKGKYKLWISYRGQDSKVGLVKVFVDGVEMTRQINMLENGNKFTSIEEKVLESQGYKRHVYPTTGKMNCRLVGTVDITTTARHTLTLQSQSAFSAAAWFDVAEFRPVDMDQLYPKFESGGDGFYKP